MSNLNSKSSPWNELDYYKEGQPIYGRDDEIWKISNAINQNLQTILYGQSGIGKSSLLFAGVFPRLRQSAYFPVFIRLGMFLNKEYANVIIDEVINEAQRIDQQIGKLRINIKERNVEDSLGIRNDENLKLWWFFNTTEFVNDFGEPYVPVLVFDQFEEILNNRVTHSKALQFILDLYNLLDDTKITPDGCVEYSNYRIVISLREDYLYCLEDIIDKFSLTELRYNRFRINALSEQKARDVILKTSEGALEKGYEIDICNKVIEEATNYMGEVNTLMLSLICSTAYINSGDGIIRMTSLDNCDDQLYYYYANKMGVVGLSTRNYLEKVLVTNDGRRDSIDIKEAVESGKILYEQIEELEKSRMIRIVTSGDNNRRIEFIHDKITTIINSKKQTFYYSLVHAIKNVFNLNSRASIKEVKAIRWIWLISIVLLCAFWYISIRNNVDKNIELYCRVLLYELVGVSTFALFSTVIRRCHDLGISGFKFLPNAIKVYSAAPSSAMYTNGISHAFASWMSHRYRSLTRKEFLSIHIYLMFYGLFLLYLLSPLSVFLDNLDNGIWIFCCFYIYIILCIYILGYFTFLRLPSMRISPWFGIVPIVPWIIGFYKRKDEIYIEINVSKGLMWFWWLYIVCVFTVVIISSLN